MNSEREIQSRVFSNHLNEHGFETLNGVFTFEDCDLLAEEISAIYTHRQTTSRKKIGGVRNLLGQSRRVADFASAPKLKRILSDRTDRPAFPVRTVFFDKTPDANWLVPWHQDLTISVSEKISVAGFSGWSIKDDVLHVQPPREILEGMVVVRIHLDRCDAANGALRVISGSHLHGKLSAAQIAEKAKQRAVVCEIAQGGILLMSPLLLHSSSPAETPSHRRVLHIDYATQNLPGGLRWFEAT